MARLGLGGTVAAICFRSHCAQLHTAHEGERCFAQRRRRKAVNEGVRRRVGGGQGAGGNVDVWARFACGARTCK